MPPNIKPWEYPIKALQAMLCWNRGTSEVKVVPWPDTTDASHSYRCTALACNLDFREATKDRRRALIFITAMDLIIRDRCPAEAVHAAMLSIDEYRQSLAPDTPGAEA